VRAADGHTLDAWLPAGGTHGAIVVIQEIFVNRASVGSSSSAPPGTWRSRLDVRCHKRGLDPATAEGAASPHERDHARRALIDVRAASTRSHAPAGSASSAITGAATRAEGLSPATSPRRLPGGGLTRL
jgi:hypothetical protein